MDDISAFLRIFLINASTMMTMLYLASLLYKYIVYKWSARQKEALFVVLAIACGWTTMRFGFRFSDTVIFDLRYLVLIASPLFVRNRLSILVIGLGIGLARLSFGVNKAAVVGCLNVIAMSLLVIFILWFARRYRLTELRKLVTLVLSVNAGNVLFIALFGIIPPRHYLVDIAPGTFLVSMLLCFGFMFILQEFMREDRRKQKLELYTARLEKQYRISEEKGQSLELAKVELEGMYKQVEAASRYKSEFLANMSHELRTPLNSVLVLAQLLEENIDGRMTDEEVGYARIIRHSGKELLGLINDVLDLSKIEAGRLELDRSAFSIEELLLHIEERFRPIADQKRLMLRLNTEGEMPEYLYTDEQRLKQIISNLLSNALKFTQRGTVSLTVSRVDSGRLLEEGGLAFIVADTGIGIAADKQEAIFDAFFQADGSISRAYGGTGLGLSIAKQFALMLGGDIMLESEPGAGSRFTLLLPWPALSTLEAAALLRDECAGAPDGAEPSREWPSGERSAERAGLAWPQAEAAREGADSAAAAGADAGEAAQRSAGGAEGAADVRTGRSASASDPVEARPHRLLIVDDDEHNVYSLRAALDARGYRILTAYSGVEALGLLSGSAVVDLVLMDIMMPGMDGLEAARRIRSMPGRSGVPIIALTAKAFFSDSEQCLESGVDFYMTKPVDLGSLTDKIETYIRGSREAGWGERVNNKEL
ncbi:ATP-binding protein [Cohnella sp. 56]|uniref:ATP-binding protein n=1 Tax=Cohnella sp. 56 TaxID=3113722 RepID=UPI0030E8C567